MIPDKENLRVLSEILSFCIQRYSRYLSRNTNCPSYHTNCTNLKAGKQNQGKFNFIFLVNWHSSLPLAKNNTVSAVYAMYLFLFYEIFENLLYTISGKWKHFNNDEKCFLFYLKSVFVIKIFKFIQSLIRKLRLLLEFMILLKFMTS